MISIHRKPQFDLWAPETVPYICVHVRAGRRSRRIFCLWPGGVQVGRRYWRLTQKGVTRNGVSGRPS